MTTSANSINSLQVSNHFVTNLFDRLSAMTSEWQTRRAIQKSLGGLTGQQLQDLGLIQDDVDAACSGELSRTADLALRASAAKRSGNW